LTLLAYSNTHTFAHSQTFIDKHSFPCWWKRNDSCDRSVDIKWL